MEMQKVSFWVEKSKEYGAFENIKNLAMYGRRADGTQMKHMKCVFASVEENSEKAGEMLSEACSKALNRNTAAIKDVRKQVSDVMKGVSNITDVTKGMAVNVDKIYSATKSLKALECVNIGLNMANIAVDIAGFVIICKKINELSTQIQEISNRIEKLKNIETYKKIREFRELEMSYKSILSKINLNEDVDLDQLEKLVQQFTCYLNELLDIQMSNSMNTELLLTIINTLMSAYTLITCELIDRYYFEKGTVAPNYDSYIAFFNRMLSRDYAKNLEEYFFYEVKMNTVDAIDAVDAQFLLALNGRVQLEDQLEILKELKTKENVEKFKEECEEYSKQEFIKICEELSNTSEVWKEEYQKLVSAGQ